MTDFDLLIDWHNDEGGEIYSDLELRTFLESGTGMTQEQVDEFMRNLRNFWSEADVTDQIFSSIFKKSAKPIPLED